MDLDLLEYSKAEVGKVEVAPEVKVLERDDFEGMLVGRAVQAREFLGK